MNNSNLNALFHSIYFSEDESEIDKVALKYPDIFSNLNNWIPLVVMIQILARLRISSQVQLCL
tara:strand:+ start:4298 stop:4486 length:189 start_codon:yes stop_codon:yes gene_type:complete